MKAYLAIVLLIPIAFAACNEDETPICAETPEEVWSIKLSVQHEYAECTLKNLNPGKEEVNVIIQTPEEFDALNSCIISDHRLNFDYYTILAGRLKTPGGGRVLKQWVTKTCDRLTLHVEIGWRSGTELADVFYYAVVDKIDDKQKVDFDVQILDCEGDSSLEPEIISYSTFPLDYYCTLKQPELNREKLNHASVIINSQADYEYYFACVDASLTEQPLPPIDFNVYTILAGRIVGSLVTKVVNQSIQKKCNYYFYQAELVEGVFGDLTVFTYYAIVPKIDDESVIYFDFYIK